MEFGLLKRTEEYEVIYKGNTYLMKITNDEKAMTDSILIYGNGGELIDDKLTEEIYDQFKKEC